jgi:hypothetical protein
MDEHNHIQPKIVLPFLDNDFASKLINSSTESSETYNQKYLNTVALIKEELLFQTNKT